MQCTHLQPELGCGSGGARPPAAFEEGPRRRSGVPAALTAAGGGRQRTVPRRVNTVQGVRDPHTAVNRQPAEGKTRVPEEEKVEEVTSFRSNEREGGRERERGVPATPPESEVRVPVGYCSDVARCATLQDACVLSLVLSRSPSLSGESESTRGGGGGGGGFIDKQRLNVGR